MLIPWWIPIILGVVEGLTEFLPVSSTGHLIVAGYALGFQGEFAKTFEIAIQLGSILAVVVYFRRQLRDLSARVPTDPAAYRFVCGIGLAFLPSAFLGLLTHHAIKTYLFAPKTVGMALVVGGMAILVIEKWYATTVPRITAVEATPIRTAIGVGIAQCLALFPGVSRAGATMMGGLLLGMDRKTAAEFSFFLALPTMIAATVYDTYKSRALLGQENLVMLGLGFAMAFLTALVVIHLFLSFVKRYSFRVFAYYRIVFGTLVLLIFWS